LEASLPVSLGAEMVDLGEQVVGRVAENFFNVFKGLVALKRTAISVIDIIKGYHHSFESLV